MANHIFISYRWSDGISEDLKDSIESCTGLEAFLDSKELRSGDYKNTLANSVKTAYVFMPVVTKSYIDFGTLGGRDEDKDYCLWEYANAIVSRKK